MNRQMANQGHQRKPTITPSASGLLQRQCACGKHTMAGGDCEECSNEKRSGLQTKLAVGEPGDVYEREADRIADQVLATPTPLDVRSAPLRIQRFAGQPTARAAPVPASVDSTLSSPGRPLEPTLRRDMEQRFGHDFSRVRVHTGAVAERSAREMNASAYTVRHDIVFGERQYSPHTLGGQQLLAHELVHTLQQSMSAESAGMVHRQASLDIALRSPTVTAQVLGSEILDGFKLNSHTLTAEHKRRLLALAMRLKQLLREHQLGTIEITGHTDATGDEALNDQLGQDRADAVATFLQGAGVPAMALLAESAGESALRVPTDKVEPRNRRVEIRFLPELPAPSLPTPEPGTAESPESSVRIPRPENLCTEHPEICEPITTKPEVSPRCTSTECFALSTRPFEEQPPELQRVLAASFPDPAGWFKNELDRDRRSALTSIYNRLCQLGLWCRVRKVVGVRAGEAPVSVWGVKVKVPGLSVSVDFVTDDNLALLDALISSGANCVDTGLGGTLHAGQTSVRQRSTSDSLHVAVGSGNLSDVHVDLYASVTAGGESFPCRYDVVGTLAHLGREVFPEKFRSLVHWLTGWMKFGALPIVRDILRTGTAGVQVFPDFTLTPTVPQGEPATRQEAVPPPIVGITWRRLIEEPKRSLVPPEAKRVSPDVGELGEEVVQRIQLAIEQQVSPEALLPSQVRLQLTALRKAADEAGPDEEEALRVARDAAEKAAATYPDAHDVALNLAVRMVQARRRGMTWVKLELEPYPVVDPYGHDRIVGEIRRFALILRNYLLDRVAGVNTVVIIFRSENSAVRYEIKLPGWVEREKGMFD